SSSTNCRHRTPPRSPSRLEVLRGESYAPSCSVTCLPLDCRTGRPTHPACLIDTSMVVRGYPEIGVEMIMKSKRCAIDTRWHEPTWVDVLPRQERMVPPSAAPEAL